MKNNISAYVGKKIKHYRTLRKMTQKELGLKIGVKHNTVSSYENGTNEPEQDILFAIAKVLDISINDLFPPIKGSYEPVGDGNQIVAETKYSYFPTSISAGLPICVDSITSYSAERIELPNSVMGKWAGHKDVFITRVNGDSMNKIIPHNSLIAVKPIELSELKNGDVVVFSDNGDYSVKRFYLDKEHERVVFRPDSYDSSFFDYIVSWERAKDIKIHGKVVLYIVELD